MSAFALPGARRHDGPDRTVAVHHIDLVLRPDLARQTLAGVCTLTLTCVADTVARVDLDASDMHVESVGDEAGSLAFLHRNGTLSVKLREPLERGDHLTLAITYHIVNPQRGLFFVAPGPMNPDDPRQCWTHSHAGGARYWFPCLDHAQQRQSSTITIEVAGGLFALANGELQSREQNARAGTTLFRYVQAQRQPTYLFTLVVGHFVEVARGAASIPVAAYVEPGREADGERTFGKTAAMVAALERFTGRSYPFTRYSQIAVAAFPFIGMENTTASTFTDDWLLQAGTLASPAVESLVVHELAHQWFGNFLTSREWTDVWLNEGFASYCEAIWDEAQSGWDAYVYNIFRQLKTYLGEAASKYTRPLICAHFRDPIDLFDKHLYEKASAMLHMLRGELGETRFQRAIERYVNDGAASGIETIDLIRAIETATGRNTRAFFDQWTRRSGHPIVTVSFEFDVARRLAHVRCRQRQPVDAGRPAFTFTLEIGFLDQLPQRLTSNAGPDARSGEQRVRMTVDSAVATCTIALDAAPALVRIDPGAWVLGEFTLELGTHLACATLGYDPNPIARIRAARALAADLSLEARTALAAAMMLDPFWGNRAEYAAILGDVRAPWAEAILLRATLDPQAAVRRAVCEALGNYRGAPVVAALCARIDADAAVEVVGAALHALGQPRDPGIAHVLCAALERRSWRDVIGGGALLGLAEIGDDRALHAAYDALLDPSPLRRQSAIRALGILALRRPVERGAIVSRLIDALNDSVALTRLDAIGALDALGDTAAIVPLEQLALREPIGWVRSHADRAALRIRTQAPSTQQLDALTSDVQILRARDEELRARIATIETSGTGTASLDFK